MKDFLEDIFSTVQFKSAVYFKYGFCSPWGMDIPKGNFSQFHLVNNGTCVLQLEHEQIELQKGDIVIFPHGKPHQIKGKSNVNCRPGQEVVAAILNGEQPFDGDFTKTDLICGHYEMDKAVSHSIFEELPEYLIVKSSDYGRYDLIASIFELLAEELTHK